MKIGFFSPTINKIGGGELVTLNMIRALKKKDHKVVIYSSNKINQSSIQNFLGEKINYYEEIIIGPNCLDPYSLENIYPNLLKSFIFKHKCDFLIDTFSDAVFPWSNAVYFQKNERAKRLPKNMKGLFFIPYKAYLNNFKNQKRAENVTLMACSQFAARSIQRSSGQKVNVLYPPVSDFFKLKSGGNMKSDMVATVSRISSDKRPESIASIAKLSQRDLSFVIIGSCRSVNELTVLRKLKDDIRQLGIEKKVKLLINVSKEKQREILQKAKIYLHPHVPYEGFGISVVEAMSAGCVPIVPDTGGLKEIVPKRLRYSNVNEAAFLVEKTLDNWSSSQAIESKNSAEKFNQDRFCEEFISLMKF